MLYVCHNLQLLDFADLQISGGNTIGPLICGFIVEGKYTVFMSIQTDSTRPGMALAQMDRFHHHICQLPRGSFLCTRNEI